MEKIRIREKRRFLDPGSWIRDKHSESTALEQRSNAELTGMVKRALTLYSDHWIFSGHPRPKFNEAYGLSADGNIIHMYDQP